MGKSGFANSIAASKRRCEEGAVWVASCQKGWMRFPYRFVKLYFASGHPVPSDFTSFSLLLLCFVPHFVLLRCCS